MCQFNIFRKVNWGNFAEYYWSVGSLNSSLDVKDRLQMIVQAHLLELRFGEFFALNGQLLVQLFLDVRFFLITKMLGEKVDDLIDPPLEH